MINKNERIYGGSYLDSIHLSLFLFYFNQNVSNFIDYFIFFKDLILYIKKKFIDGFQVFQKNSFKIINNEESENYIIHLLYPLIKIYDIKNKFDLNKIYIEPMEEESFYTKNIKNFERTIIQAQSVISFGFITREEIANMRSSINAFKSLNIITFIKFYEKIINLILKL